MTNQPFLSRKVSKSFFYTLLTIVLLRLLFSSLCLPGIFIFSIPTTIMTRLGFTFWDHVGLLPVYITASALLGFMFVLLRRKASILLAVAPICLHYWYLLLIPIMALYGLPDYLPSRYFISLSLICFLSALLGAYLTKIALSKNNNVNREWTQWPKDQDKWVTAVVMVLLVNYHQDLMTSMLNILEGFKTYFMGIPILSESHTFPHIGKYTRFMESPVVLKLIAGLLTGLAFAITRQRTSFYFAFIPGIASVIHLYISKDIYSAPIVSYHATLYDLIFVILITGTTAMAGAYLMRRFIARYPWNDEASWKD